jgi:hypothetical protein
VQAEIRENCGQLKRNAHLHLETRTMTVTPAHLRSIVDHDGAVILDILGNRMTTLNTTGAYIWARLQEGRTTDSIVAELARETGEEPQLVETDVLEFIEQLKGKRLLNS